MIITAVMRKRKPKSKAKGGALLPSTGLASLMIPPIYSTVPNRSGIPHRESPLGVSPATLTSLGGDGGGLWIGLDWIGFSVFGELESEFG